MNIILLTCMLPPDLVVRFTTIKSPLALRIMSTAQADGLFVETGET